MSDALTPKQEAFARAYLETGNASEAYRRAYDASAMSAEAVNVEACRLLEHPKVTPRLAELRSMAQQRNDVTIDSLSKMLKDAFDLAMTPAVTAPAAAVAAAMALGKLHGLIIEKKHVTGDHKHNHSAEPLSESAQWLSGLLGGGADREAEKPLPNGPLLPAPVRPQ